MRTRRTRRRITIAGVLSVATVVTAAVVAGSSVPGLGFLDVGALTTPAAGPQQLAATSPEASQSPLAVSSSAPSPNLTPSPPDPPSVMVDDPLRVECAGSTTMSVWAHSDDDLLFLGSQIDDALASGGCVRTVYLTDGDAGRGPGYAAGRVLGIQRAYDLLRGEATPWTDTDVTLPSGATVTVRRPEDDSRVSLIFLHLPDGNLTGVGFPGTGDVSLAKLASNTITTIPPTNGAMPLSWAALVASLDELITNVSPNTLYTHVPGASHTLAKGDHADHAVTGTLVRAAWRHSPRTGQIAYAMGYQTATHPANVKEPALSRKIAAFIAYAADDPVVSACRDAATCLALPRFGAWLQRQYLSSDADLGLG